MAEENNSVKPELTETGKLLFSGNCLAISGEIRYKVKNELEAAHLATAPTSKALIDACATKNGVVTDYMGRVWDVADYYAPLVIVEAGKIARTYAFPGTSRNVTPIITGSLKDLATGVSKVMSPREYKSTWEGLVSRGYSIPLAQMSPDGTDLFQFKSLWSEDGKLMVAVNNAGTIDEELLHLMKGYKVPISNTKTLSTFTPLTDDEVKEWIAEKFRNQSV